MNVNSHIVYIYQKNSQIVYWTKHDLDLVVECFRRVWQDSKSTVHHQNTHVDLKREPMLVHWCSMIPLQD